MAFGIQGLGFSVKGGEPSTRPASTEKTYIFTRAIVKPPGKEAQFLQSVDAAWGFEFRV